LIISEVIQSLWWNFNFWRPLAKTRGWPLRDAPPWCTTVPFHLEVCTPLRALPTSLNQMVEAVASSNLLGWLQGGSYLMFMSMMEGFCSHSCSEGSSVVTPKPIYLPFLFVAREYSSLLICSIPLTIECCDGSGHGYRGVGGALWWPG